MSKKHERRINTLHFFKIYRRLTTVQFSKFQISLETGQTWTQDSEGNTQNRMHEDTVWYRYYLAVTLYISFTTEKHLMEMQIKIGIKRRVTRCH